MSGDRRGGGFYATVRVISTAAKNGGHGDGERRRDGDVTTAVAVVAGGDEPVILMSHTMARPRPAKLYSVRRRSRKADPSARGG